MPFALQKISRLLLLLLALGCIAPVPGVAAAASSGGVTLGIEGAAIHRQILFFCLASCF